MAKIAELHGKTADEIERAVDANVHEVFHF